MRERHLHLSGATSVSLLWELITQSGLKTAAKGYWEFERTVLMGQQDITSLDDYISVLHGLEKTQSSPQAIELCVYDAFKTSYLAGVTDMELRWNPVKRSQHGSLDLDRLIVAARSGYERAESTFGIKSSMIFCMGRDCSQAENLAIWGKAKKYFRKGCNGIDVAGPERVPLANHPEFEQIYKEAADLGMERTIHVGETPHSLTEEELDYVLTVLKPNRIGHGTQIHKYPALMEKARQLGVHFEVCISSNLATKSVASLEEFSTILGLFKEFSLDYSINTDSTHLLQTTLAKEYALHQGALSQLT